MNDPASTEEFLVTKEHRRFVEFCQACRKDRYIGLCYGRAGVGKTKSARVYAHWDQIEALDGLRPNRLPLAPEIMECRTIFYTPAVANNPGQIEKEVRLLRLHLGYLLVDMEQTLKGTPEEAYPVIWDAPDLTELIIIDEADRLKTAGLEQIRDTYDRSKIGVNPHWYAGYRKTSLPLRSTILSGWFCASFPTC